MLAEIPVIPDILRRHAEGAAFLWTRRAASMHDAAMGETEIGRLDRRLAAHLAGLVASGSAAMAELNARFEAFPEPGEAFALFSTALVAGDAAAAEAALDALQAHPACWPGLSGALAWAGPAALAPHVRGWAGAGDPLRRYLAVAAHSQCRGDPGDWLDRFLADGEPRVRARALRLIGEIGRVDRADAALRALEAGGEAERFWAARSALLLGRAEAALPVLRGIAAQAAPPGDAALELAVIGDAGADLRRWIGTLLQDPARGDSAVAICGAIEGPDVLDWLIECAGDPGRSAAAGRALRAACDFDLDDTDAFEADPAVLGAGFADRDDGPWPVPDRVRAAIRAHGGAGTFRALPAQRRACLRAAIATPEARLGEWRHRRHRPAWT